MRSVLKFEQIEYRTAHGQRGQMKGQLTSRCTLLRQLRAIVIPIKGSCQSKNPSHLPVLQADSCLQDFSMFSPSSIPFPSPSPPSSSLPSPSSFLSSLSFLLPLSPSLLSPLSLPSLSPCPPPFPRLTTLQSPLLLRAHNIKSQPNRFVKSITQVNCPSGQPSKSEGLIFQLEVKSLAHLLRSESL